MLCYFCDFSVSLKLLKNKKFNKGEEIVNLLASSTMLGIQ